MNYRQTNMGNRPDLAAVEVNWPLGYLAPMLFPIASAAEKAGDFTFAEVVTDAAAETNRTWNSALGLTRVASGTKAYSCAPIEKRHGLTENDVKDCGGLDNADKVGATASKRSVMRAIEDLAHALVFSSARRTAATTLVAGAEFLLMTQVANAIRRVKGKITLVCGPDFYQGLIGLTAVTNRLNAVGALGAVFAQGVAAGLQPELVSRLLSTILPVEQVLIGDSAHWGTYPDHGALVMMPDMAGMDAAMAAKLDPIYGLAKAFRPDPATAGLPVMISTDWLPSEKVNAYDATAHIALLELNTAGCALVKLPSGTLPTTTTTTTAATTTTTTGA